MFQNLKVDIVYYKTNTDFEMEFNLCGCCRMRLLTDKAPDSKSAVRSLSRAVSRSRVILVIGALFGDDGVINIISKAIDTSLREINNKTYGISGNDEIEILEGATPLVTNDGYFGGCIIERGPQTMILLTENKTIRKALMKSLIHPYIEELCAVELNEKATAAKGTAQEESVDVTLNTLADEYESVAAELFVDNESTEEQPNEIDTEISDGLESELMFDDEAQESKPIDLEDEYEQIAEALYTNQDDSQEQEYEVDPEISEGLESALLVEDEFGDEKNSIILDDEYERMADALYTEVDNIENQIEEIDSDILDGTEAPFIMDDESDNNELIDLDEEYEKYASTLYTETNTKADLNRKPDDVSETTQAEEDALFKSGFIYENQEEETDSSEDEQAEHYHSNQRSINRLNLFILIMVAFLLVLLAILCYSIFFVPAKSGENIGEYIKEIFNTLF